MSTARYIVGDTRDVTATLPDNSVELIMTSPPFLALRSYLPDGHPDKHREIGSEPDPATFIDTLLELTAEWERVLAPHGSICVELGDTYSGNNGKNETGWHRAGAEHPDRYRNRGAQASTAEYCGDGWPLAKSLALIPELYRIALAYGVNPLTGRPSPAGRWRVRNVVRWVRPNPPVGALGDKFRPATSDLVIACKSKDRWFDMDAVRTAHTKGPGGGRFAADGTPYKSADTCSRNDDGQGFRNGGNPAGAPPLDWWNITTSGYSGSHYAVFPPELCVKPIKAMCPTEVCRECRTPRRRITEPGSFGEWRDNTPAKVNSGGPGTHGHRTRPPQPDTWSDCGCAAGYRPGVVFDPFAGSGTTLAVATGHGRNAIGIDLDERNADLARERIGMFVTIEHHKATT